MPLGKISEQAECYLQMEEQSTYLSPPSLPCLSLFIYLLLCARQCAGRREPAMNRVIVLSAKYKVQSQSPLSARASGHIWEDEAHLYPLCWCAHLLRLLVTEFTL